MRLRPAFPAAAALSALVALSGCSASFTPPVTTAPTSFGVIQGLVHGGRQGITGAHLFVFAAGTTADAGPGIAATSSNASTSLIKSTAAGAQYDSTVGGYYILTGLGGFFTLTSDYACTPNTQVYLYAVSGMPDGMNTNTAAGLMAVLGNCPSTGTLAVQTPTVYITEVSTIAAAYALAGFASDPTHVSSNGSTLALTGIANAFANAANLVDIAHNPAITARSAPLGGNGIVPTKLINSLANSIAACVNSSGTQYAQCSTLFSNAEDFAGNRPADTAAAAINIAHAPAANVYTLFTLPGPIGEPFTPNLGASTPNDFTIGITYNGFDGPYGLAIDAAGNAWVADGDNGNSANNALLKLSSLGQLSNTFIDPGFTYALDVAIDANGSAWTTGYLVTRVNTSNAIAEINRNTLPSPQSVAIDASNNVFVDNLNPSQLVELNDSNGAQDSGSPMTQGTQAQDQGLAIDHNGNLWIFGNTSATLTRIASPGTSATGTTYATGLSAGISTTERALAIDSGNFLWAAGETSTAATSGTLVKLNNNGSIAATYTGASAGLYPTVGGMAIDGSGNIWIGNTNASVSEFSSAGLALSPSTGFTGGNQGRATKIAVDGSGDVWVTNLGAAYPYDNGTTIIELIGAATPVVTPISPTYPGKSTTGLGVRP
jgi:hypothetical protein